MAPESWRASVCHLRYTDDVLAASHWYCVKCLQAAVALIYEDIPFDFSQPIAGRLPWLDMVISEQTGEIGLNIKPFPAPPPWAVEKKGFLRCIFLGKFKRWNVIQPALLSWQRASIALLFDLHNANWTKCKVKSALFSIGVPEYRKFVLFMIDSIKHIFMQH